jgi:hypothetical protein
MPRSERSPRARRHGRLAAFCLPLLLAGALVASAPAARTRPSLFKIDLKPSKSAPSARGTALLRPARSPFGFALTTDGHFVFDVEVALEGLPAPSALGAFTSYAVWATKADLSEARLIGVAGATASVKGQVSYNKFLLVVTAEQGAPGAMWKGPILLRGFSPSSLLENFSGKTMFNGGMPQ